MSLLDLWVLYMILGSLLVLLAGAWVLFGIARRHRADDERAAAKAAAGIVFALLLGGAGYYGVAAFQASATVGMHDTLYNTLNRTIGEPEYQDALLTISKRTQTIAAHQQNLTTLNARLDAYVAANPEHAEAVATSKVSGLPQEVQDDVAARDRRIVLFETAVKELAAAQATSLARTPNHLLWQQVSALLRENRDAEAEAMVAKAIRDDTVTEVIPATAETIASGAAPCVRERATGKCVLPFQPKAVEATHVDGHGHLVKLADGGPAAFEDQRKFGQQMDVQLKLFVYSSLTGLLMAPIVFAGGSILRSAYVPSDTVGFKPYPSKSGGWFLLLGAFGVVAIPFAAWAVRDLHKRSIEGQIAL
jgi:hypothetical protein